MIRFSETQAALVQAARERRFRARSCALVLRRFPEACRRLGGERVGRIIDLALHTGRRHGITGKRDLQRFIAWHFLLDEAHGDLRTLPWLRAILEDNSLANGSQRMLLLDSAVRHYLTTEARLADDPVAATAGH